MVEHQAFEMQETQIDREETRNLRSRFMKVHYVVVALIGVVLLGLTVAFAIKENFFGEDEEGQTTTTTESAR